MYAAQVFRRLYEVVGLGWVSGPSRCCCCCLCLRAPPPPTAPAPPPPLARARPQVYALTRYKPVEDAANALYGVWAKYRLPITGRPDLQVVLAQKRACGAGEDAACELPQQQ